MLGPFTPRFVAERRLQLIRSISTGYPLRLETLVACADKLSRVALAENPRLPWSEGLVREHAGGWSAWSSVRRILWRLARRRGSVEPLRWALEHGPDRGRERLEAAIVGWEGVGRWLATKPLWLSDLIEWPAHARDELPGLLRGAPRLAWHALANNSSFPWTEDFVEAHLDELDFNALSQNPGFWPSVEFIRRHAERWNWHALLATRWHEAVGEDFAALVEFVDQMGFFGRPLVAIHGMRLTVESFEIMRGPIERADARSGRRRNRRGFWTYDFWPQRWSAELVDHLVDLEPALGEPTINWERLARDGGAQLWTPAFFERHAATLDPEGLCENLAVIAALPREQVEDFLASSPRLEQELRSPTLEARIAEEPARFEGYAVYADWLEARGDPQAERIQASLAGEARPEGLGEEGHELLGPPKLRHGFVREASLHLFHPFNWDESLRLRSFAFVEELRFLDDGDQSYFERIYDRDWELLADLPCLRRLALQHAAIWPSPALAELSSLTHLDLCGSWIEDLSILSGLQGLRSLALDENLFARVRPRRRRPAGDARVDLGPLARLPELRALSLQAGSPRIDLRPLRACRRLQSLELRGRSAPVGDELAALPGTLRRLWVRADDDPGVFESLRAARPELELNGAGSRPWRARPELERDPAFEWFG